MINVQQNYQTERRFLKTGKLLVKLTLEGGELVVTVLRTKEPQRTKIQSCVV
jgi:hypothetical protein